MKHLLITIAAAVLVGTAYADPIHDAAYEGNIEAVKQYLAAGGDVNAKNQWGMTPLHYVARTGVKEIIELLIAEGADVNAKDRGGWTSLHTAAVHGQTEAVELLITKGADVNAKDDRGRTPLDWANDPNYPNDTAKTADLLREHGGKSGAEFSIHVAAELGNAEAVKQHLDAGVNVNAKHDNGVTPLHGAALWGHKEIAELLIENGADVNAKNDEGGTPLHHATEEGHKEIAELLIANGADVNAKNDRGGYTPLHEAALNGRREVAELLISKGADVNVLDGSGYTPLDWAIIANYSETANLLRKHGGKTGEELALMPRLVQHGRFAFSFDAKAGKVYEVQDSFDLLNWEVIKTYTGTGVSVRFDEERDHDPPKWFYRVRVVE